MIYFDNASTSFPKADGVGEEMEEFIEKNSVNISRGGYEKAYELQGKVTETRDKIKNLFNAGDSYIMCFTSGATFSLNIFLQGYLNMGDHVIISSLEHNAVVRTLKALEKRGVEHSAAKCDSEGILDIESVKSLIRENTKAILMSHVSNVAGTIIPVDELGEICRENGLVFALDAAQSAGSVPINMERSGIDFLAFSGHKGLLGPQGVGGFVAKEDLARNMDPLIYGGTGSFSDEETQPSIYPDKFESGTLPLPAIMGLSKALDFIEKTGVDNIRKKEQKLTQRFLEGISKIDGVRIRGVSSADDTEKRAGVVSVDFSSVDNAIAAFALEHDYGIMTRVGLHCSPEAHMALGTFPKGTLRFAFGYFNTEEEIDTAIKGIREVALK